ncbi:MAG: ankyrin repeat domain-containing protein, partial [archaeon]|nr:ankyrin repeat domain-containing protein [archaeon]
MLPSQKASLSSATLEANPSLASSGHTYLVAEASELDDIMMDWQVLLSGIVQERELSLALYFSAPFLVWFCRRHFKLQQEELGLAFYNSGAKERKATEQLHHDAMALYRTLEACCSPFSSPDPTSDPSISSFPTSSSSSFTTSSTLSSTAITSQDMTRALREHGERLLLWSEPSSGRTLFHLVALQGSVELLSTMLDAATPHAVHDLLYSRCNSGWTALFFATSRGHQDAVSLLLDRGVSVHGLDKLARSVLHIAVLSDHCELAQLFLRCGAGPNELDSMQRTPLFYAVQVRSEPLLDALVKAGADSRSLERLPESAFDGIEKDETYQKILRLIKAYSDIASAFEAHNALLGSEVSSSSSSTSTSSTATSTSSSSSSLFPSPPSPSSTSSTSPSPLPSPIPSSSSNPSLQESDESSDPAPIPHHTLTYNGPDRVAPALQPRRSRSGSLTPRAAMSSDVSAAMPSRQTLSMTDAWPGAGDKVFHVFSISGSGLRRCAACRRFILTLSSLECASCGLSIHRECSKVALLGSVCGGPDEPSGMESLQTQYQDIFSEKELGCIHDRFQLFGQMLPSPVTAQSFCTAVGLLHGNANVGASLMATLLGPDGTSFNFSGFIGALAIICRGTLEQRLTLGFLCLSRGQPRLDRASVLRLLDGIKAGLHLAGIAWELADAFQLELLEGLNLQDESSSVPLNAYI